MVTLPKATNILNTGRSFNGARIGTFYVLVVNSHLIFRLQVCYLYISVLSYLFIYDEEKLAIIAYKIAEALQPNFIFS